MKTSTYYRMRLLSVHWVPTLENSLWLSLSARSTCLAATWLSTSHLTMILNSASKPDILRFKISILFNELISLISWLRYTSKIFQKIIVFSLVITTQILLLSLKITNSSWPTSSWPKLTVLSMVWVIFLDQIYLYLVSVLFFLLITTFILVNYVYLNKVWILLLIRHISYYF